MTDDHRFRINTKEPTVLVLGDEASEKLDEVTHFLELRLGATVPVTANDDCLVMPPSFEVQRHDSGADRGLRGDEAAEYHHAILHLADSYPDAAVRYRIEVVYLIDWDAMDEVPRETLRNIYEKLPGWLELDGMPRWFGRDETTGPFLWASMEPPGLQVFGLLELDDFDAWHERFLEEAAEIPFRMLV